MSKGSSHGIGSVRSGGSGGSGGSVGSGRSGARGGGSVRSPRSGSTRSSGGLGTVRSGGGSGRGTRNGRSESNRSRQNTNSLLSDGEGGFPIYNNNTDRGHRIDRHGRHHHGHHHGHPGGHGVYHGFGDFNPWRNRGGAWFNGDGEYSNLYGPYGFNNLECNNWDNISCDQRGRYAPLNNEQLYPLTLEYSTPQDFQTCCLNAGMSEMACMSAGTACPVAMNSINSGAYDAASVQVAAACCPIAYQQWASGYGSPSY
jgi:hypothetical protein